MKKKAFCGTATALITPFRNEKIDYGALDGIIDMQLSGGVAAIVIGGTTGEAATLSPEERDELYSFARERIPRDTPFIFGTGANDTAETIKRTRHAAKIGCDAALVVTPYYNKGTVSGVTEHYLKVANCSDLPIIVYNVPGRTGVNLTFPQLEAFAKCDKIIGIKEATDSMDRFVKISVYGDELPLYSGNDNSIYSALALGGAGVISVVSNLLPSTTESISKLFFAKRFADALLTQQQLIPLIDAIFAETNPSPIKYAMSLLGLCEADVRLPLSKPLDSTREALKGAMHALGIEL
jgi:4-hydroxy-tetrahydrodipicolinate synthase